MALKVYFSHGQESGPWGTKIQRLAACARDLNWELESIDYQGMAEPAARVRKLLESAGQDRPGSYVLVGSSMGGYVSLAAAERLQAAGLFLMAPAVFMPAYPQTQIVSDQAHLEVVHGWRDEIIPVENVLSFARQSRCDLHVLDADHRLSGPALDRVATLFVDFLRRVKADLERRGLNR